MTQHVVMTPLVMTAVRMTQHVVMTPLVMTLRDDRCADDTTRCDDTFGDDASR